VRGGRRNQGAEEPQLINGLLAINKPEDWTSNDVVQKASVLASFPFMIMHVMLGCLSEISL
jgi:hypothetical protein